MKKLMEYLHNTGFYKMKQTTDIDKDARSVSGGQQHAEDASSPPN